MKICCRNGADSPFSFWRKCISLVVWCRCCNLENYCYSLGTCSELTYHFVTMLVDSSSLCSSQLRLILSLRLDFLNLLTLLGRCSDFHTQNNITNFGLGQGGHIYVILLTIIGFIGLFFAIFSNENKTKVVCLGFLESQLIYECDLNNKPVPKIISLSVTSTLIHCSASRDGQMWCGSVKVVFSGFNKTLVRSLFTCNALKNK